MFKILKVSTTDDGFYLIFYSDKRIRTKIEFGFFSLRQRIRDKNGIWIFLNLHTVGKKIKYKWRHAFNTCTHMLQIMQAEWRCGAREIKTRVSQVFTQTKSPMNRALSLIFYHLVLNSLISEYIWVYIFL